MSGAARALHWQKQRVFPISKGIGKPLKICRDWDWKLQLFLELFISLSSNYPKEKPEVYARSSFLSRTQQLLLNQSLSDILEHQEENEPCIQVLIMWLQDNGENFLIKSNKKSRQRSHY